MTDEDDTVHVRMQVMRAANNRVPWAWSLNDCTVSLSYPHRPGGGEESVSQIDKDLTYLVYELPELVTSGVIEADVQLSMQELDEELEGLG